MLTSGDLRNIAVIVDSMAASYLLTDAVIQCLIPLSIRHTARDVGGG